ncbi:MAG: sigma-70 family RNA polymerase sigma factor [bacterium]|nr:sigma-70 family RNA polymerase sigma factor [bacterium]
MAGNDETVTLLLRWHDGDRQALLQLLDRNREWIENSVRSRRGPLLREFEETGDGVQELMLRAMEYAPRFLVANRGQFRALVARMIRHLLVDRSRSARRAPRPFTMSETDAMSARLNLTADEAVTPPVQAAARSEELGWMRLGLEFLPADERRLIKLRTFEELEFAAMGHEFAVPANTARMRFNRALLRLAGIIERLKQGELERLLEEEEAEGEAG